MSFQPRIVRDIVADTVTTDKLTANSAIVRETLTVPVLNATTVNTTTIGLPSPSLTITDVNAVLGIGTGGTWTFTLIGNVVVAQLDVISPGTVANANFMQFAIPAPYTPILTTTQPQSIAMTINGVTSFGVATVSNGSIQIAPGFGTVFTIGNTLAVFGSTFTYIIL